MLTMPTNLQRLCRPAARLLLASPFFFPRSFFSPRKSQISHANNSLFFCIVEGRRVFSTKGYANLLWLFNHFCICSAGSVVFLCCFLFFLCWINCVGVALNRDTSVRDDYATEMFEPKLYASVTVIDFFLTFYLIIIVVILTFYPERIIPLF